MGIISHYLFHIVLLGFKSQVLLTLKERGLHKGMNTGRGEVTRWGGGGGLPFSSFCHRQDVKMGNR